MPYLLDTDYVIDYLQEVQRATDLYPELVREGMWMSTVTFMEALEGTLVVEDPDAARDKLLELVRAAPLIDFDASIATVCAELRVRLRADGKRIHQRAHDLQIAATALTLGLTVVTRNLGDYSDTGAPILRYT